MRETFELIGAEIQAGGAGMLPAGLILTGGGAQLAGVAELGREVLQMPVRVVGPSGVGGLTDSILTPAYATSIGLLQWGASLLDEGEPTALRVGARDGRPRSAPERRQEHAALGRVRAAGRPASQLHRNVRFDARSRAADGRLGATCGRETRRASAPVPGPLEPP